MCSEGFKIENLNKNNNVSFCVVGKTELVPSKFSTKYESVIISGKTSEVKDNEKYDVLLKLIEKYSNEYVDKGIKYIEKSFNKTMLFRIDIIDISGKESSK